MPKLPTISKLVALSMASSQIEAHQMSRAYLRRNLQSAHDGNPKDQADLATRIEAILHAELLWHDITRQCSNPAAIRSTFVDACQAVCEEYRSEPPRLDDLTSRVICQVVAHHPDDAQLLDPADVQEALTAVQDRFLRYGLEADANINPAWRIAHHYGLFETAAQNGPVALAQRIHEIVSSPDALAPILATQQNAERGQIFFDLLLARSTLLATNTPPVLAPPVLRDAASRSIDASILDDLRAVNCDLPIHSKKAFDYFLSAFSASNITELMRPASSVASKSSFPRSFTPPSNRRFSVGIEGFILTPGSRSEVCASVRQFLRNAGCVGWAVRPAPSVNLDVTGNCPFVGLEIISPSLYGTHGQEQLSRAVRALKRAGLTQNQTCGIQVKVEVDNPTPAKIRDLLTSPGLAPLRRHPSGAKFWAVPNPIPDINPNAPPMPCVRYIEKACPPTPLSPDGVNYAVNLRSLYSHGTVGFNGLSNCIDDLPLVAQHAVKLADSTFPPPQQLSPALARSRSPIKAANIFRPPPAEVQHSSKTSSQARS
jgi:hypothetical protein